MECSLKLPWVCIWSAGSRRSWIRRTATLMTITIGKACPARYLGRARLRLARHANRGQRRHTIDIAYKQSRIHATDTSCDTRELKYVCQ
ncbi:hypothetical protein HBH56_028280 [Parastagonospora nodorum]|uniref:Uncharacterized protein n=1 Tax=Phaeosphaeria nodorum (strain SN15 / ATCC MYA-4574 / FGSC 10173) TaxID=321614 RepID=A0A7U2F5G9_PHANO|nr:hypothetical protein HBH56_028280 [Parastagonospora nodorum]QRC99101.1 hypothetical protein JI435_413030 [Parastagonospora nodorum SN15]KAH3934653.1 hypothetical protein HBH54_053760 [Parastagonospora nodorum]KAH3949607.1 hypothetical protein HBH53_081430 [Parastagonospora nodorum]KAH3976047.1 hypothetical protein HBH51_083920 [Parastagonospora nodorum]